jgi:hypothetical protein
MLKALLQHPEVLLFVHEKHTSDCYPIAKYIFPLILDITFTHLKLCVRFASYKFLANNQSYFVSFISNCCIISCLLPQHLTEGGMGGRKVTMTQHSTTNIFLTSEYLLTTP